jgi:hypothetical protein
MVGTVRAARPGRPRALAAAAFAAGLAAGGGIVFGAVGAVGSLLHPGRPFLIAAAVLAGATALADTLGLRVRPQIRFQVPEPWRRTMPLPRALFFYGLLLGTGLTTFVPAAAAWALLPLSVALASVPGAAAVGVSFAAGRALPVLALAAGRRDESSLAERPGGLRALRVLAAGSLVLALVAGEARAASRVASPAGDPSAADTDLVWQQPGVGGFLLRGGQQTQLPGNDPTVGGLFIAWHDGDQVTVAARDTLVPTLQQTISGVVKLAVSDRWLAYRVRLPSGSEQLLALSLADPTNSIAVSRPRAAGRLGRPSLSGDLVVFHTETPKRSWLSSLDLATGKRRLLRSSVRDLLLNPVQLGGKLLYVRESRCAQQLRIGPLYGNGSGHVLYALPPLAGQDAGHEHGHTGQGEHLPCRPKPKPTKRMLWTTALSETAAYVTVLLPGAGGHATPSLLAIGR